MSKGGIPVKAYQIILVVLVYVFFVGLWSLPIGDVPFGDVDASGHFALSDSQSESNGVMRVLPLYLNYSYGFANDGKPWYPPQFHLSGAVFEKLSDDRILPLFLFYLFSGTLIILTTFFLVNELFGFWPALISMLFIGVSTRDYVSYVWGLWPEKLSFALVPLVLYCAFKAKPVYLWVMSVLLATQFLVHPQGAVHSVMILVLFVIGILVVERKFPWNWKHLLGSVILFGVIVVPFSLGPLAFNKNVMAGEYGDSFRLQEFGSLLHWYPQNVPYAPEMADAGYVYGPGWFLVFGLAILGMMFCLRYHERRHLLLIAYGVGIYFLMHLNIIGITGRVHRSLNAESHIIYVLMVIGLLCFMKWWGSQSTGKMWSCFIVFGLLMGTMFCLQLHNEYVFLKSAKEDVGRVNSAQMSACTWVRDNIPVDAHLRMAGTLVYRDRKWIQALCMRPGIFDDRTFIGELSEVPLNLTTHWFFDNTQAGLTQDVVGFVGVLDQFKNSLNMSEPIYSSGGVSIYVANN